MATMTQERRSKHRRYTDRRVAIMLSMYEIFFEEPPGQSRLDRLLDAIQEDFETDIAAFVRPSNGESEFHLLAARGNWPEAKTESRFSGLGVDSLIDTHKHAPGAVTLTRVRRPASFEAPVWESIWRETLGDRSKALLSVETRTNKAEPMFLWLVQTAYSREWNSQDRELAEEVASLLARAADKES